jgi:hypothetical protein
MGKTRTSRIYEVSVGIHFTYRCHIAELPTVIKELHVKQKPLFYSLWLEGSYL